VLGLAKALGRGAFGGYVAESTAGIKGGAGIVGEDVIQRVAAAKRAFEFFAGAQRNQLAQVHDRDAITMALGLLQIMGGEEQGCAVVGSQINEMLPNCVARNRVQPTVGSSRKSTRGRWSVDWAISRRRTMPPEYSPTRRPPSAVRFMNSNASRMRACCSRVAGRRVWRR